MPAAPERALIAVPARLSPSVALLLLPLSLAPVGTSSAVSSVDRLTVDVESPLRLPPVRPPTPLRLAELGACNPRIEVCDKRNESDEAADGERNERAPERRRRGWLSVVGCNPRIKVCEG